MTQFLPTSELSRFGRIPSSAGEVKAALTFVAFAVVLVALSSSWSRFPSVWTDDRNNGFAIAALTVWVLWRDRSLLYGSGKVLPWSLPLLLGSSLLWTIAMAMSAQAIHLTLVPVILFLWLLSVRGEGVLVQGTHALALFSLALPVWGLSIPLLQNVTVAVNRALIFATGIPARVEGSLILLKSGTLEVADSCAGFNFLMAGLTVGACYAFLFAKHGRVRWRIVVAAGALSIVSNWIRVFGLVVIGHMTAMRSSLMNDHVVYGWLIFAASVLAFFHVAGRIERSQNALDVLAIESSGTNAVGTGGHSAPWRVPLATGFALIGPAIFYLLGSLQPQVSLSPTVPGVFLSGEVTDVSKDNARWSPAFTGEQERRTLVMTVDGTKVLLDRFLYSSGNNVAEMIGSSNQIAADSLIAIQRNVGPLDDQLRMAREVMLRTPDRNGRLAWYWYGVSNVTTHSPLRAKLLELWAFMVRRPSSQIVVLSATCESGDCQHARSALFKAATGKASPPVAR